MKLSVISAGNPTDFRIYKTEDGGATWTMQFQNQNPGAFYACFAFWTPKKGIAHSDSVNGVFPDLRTTDGKTWQDISNNMPPALPGEGSFAASYLDPSDPNNARTATSSDGGVTWTLTNPPPVTSRGRPFMMRNQFCACEADPHSRCRDRRPPRFRSLTPRPHASGSTPHGPDGMPASSQRKIVRSTPSGVYSAGMLGARTEIPG